MTLKSYKKIRITFFVLIALLGAFGIYKTIDDIQKFNRVFDQSTSVAVFEETHFKIRHLKISKLYKTSSEKTETIHYVTLLDQSLSASYTNKIDILNTPNNPGEILGLESHPSFKVKNTDRTFWKVQFYIEIIFFRGAFLFFLIIVFLLEKVIYKNGEKIFSKPVQKAIYDLSTYFMIGIFGGFLIEKRISGFLENEYGFDLPYTNDSLSLWTAAIIVYVLFIFIEKGITLQKEQDLTV